MAKPSFINLWNSYPPYSPVDPPACDGPWINQCAIRVSIALCGERTLAINSSTYSEPRCAHGHARGAESLANWLWKRTQIGPPKIYTNSVEDRTKLMSKKGIIFFKDCYEQSSDTAGRPTGDHIDLWNRGQTRSGDLFFRSKAIWFWELL